ncbi:hypothetical protein K431DRAFT_285099 [Polychaeton citri CBS 116435]|uniref:Methyltransferase n=1 Tax=Polychaeton citri CBS 116435 TaxID=1314669 RepID=A0A9P4UP10_9PEZI|nr:hypothetical protein K431DRAFT_285099 [Polychaeton citri CBS 116435]
MTSTSTTQTQAEPQNSTISLKGIEIPRGPIETTLSFFKDSDSKDGQPWYNYVEPQPEGTPQNNYAIEDQRVTINDLRGHEAELDLDTWGFRTVQGVESAERDFDDDARIERAYYPEVERLLLDSLPGTPRRVFIFDHTVRRSGPGAKRSPVNRAHIDQTAKAAATRVRLHMGDEAEELLQGRYRLVNVWRPINGPVVASPLAYADSRSVPDEDIVPVEHRYPHRTGETAGVKYTDKGKWYYLSGMTNDERILLQCYDSQKGARTPHTAFTDSRTEKDWPGRESIEVRALVFG